MLTPLCVRGDVQLVLVESCRGLTTNINGTANDEQRQGGSSRVVGCHGPERDEGVELEASSEIQEADQSSIRWSTSRSSYLVSENPSLATDQNMEDSSVSSSTIGVVPSGADVQVVDDTGPEQRHLCS